MQFDDDGSASPGTYAITTVQCVGHRADGSPVISVDMAVCAICGGWASELWFAGRTTAAGDDLVSRRISRRETVVVYACPDHAEQVSVQLCDEYGAASNIVDTDELAENVAKNMRQQWDPLRTDGDHE